MVINPVDDGISKAHEAQLGQWRINRSWQHGYRVCSDPACRILVYETRTFAIQGKLNGGFPRGLLFLFNKIKDQPISCLTEINQTLVVDRKAFSDSSWGRIYRSEEHTSELQSLMRISYAVFCLTKKKRTHYNL